MSRQVAVDADIVSNWAQQLEARSDPVFIAQEIRAVLAGAQPVYRTELTDELARVLKNQGGHLCTYRKPGCAMCRVLGVYEAVKVSRKSASG